MKSAVLKSLGCRRYKSEDTRVAYAFLFPSAVVFLVFTAFPFFYSLYLSFHKWNILTPVKPFVGLGNYASLFRAPDFWNAVKNTLIYSAGAILGTTLTSLALALLLWKGLRARNFFRTVYFLPVVTSLVVVAIVWSWIFDPQFGLANKLLKLIGINGPAWLYSPHWAMFALVFTSIWKHSGYYMVIFLAGLYGIPEVFYECAEVDGANGFQKLWHITLPLLRRVTALVMVMLTINSFKVFTLVYVMTGGGPMKSTETIVNYLYRQGFESFRMGYASAIAWVLFMVILLISLFQMRFIGGRRSAIGQQY
mgnify:FL=1